jgi:hypothetical protein
MSRAVTAAWFPPSILALHALSMLRWATIALVEAGFGPDERTMPGARPPAGGHGRPVEAA